MTNIRPIFELIQTIGGTAAAAKITGINPRTIARWQSGHATPSNESLDLLRKLAEARAMIPFRDRLKAARESAGLSQAQAAAAISPLLSVRTLQSWETGGDHRSEPPEWTHNFIFDRLARAVETGAGEH